MKRYKIRKLLLSTAAVTTVTLGIISTKVTNTSSVTKMIANNSSHDNKEKPAFPKPKVLVPTIKNFENAKLQSKFDNAFSSSYRPKTQSSCRQNTCPIDHDSENDPYTTISRQNSASSFKKVDTARPLYGSQNDPYTTISRQNSASSFKKVDTARPLYGSQNDPYTISRQNSASSFKKVDTARPLYGPQNDPYTTISRQNSASSSISDVSSSEFSSQIDTKLVPTNTEELQAKLERSESENERLHKELKESKSENERLHKELKESKLENEKLHKESQNIPVKVAKVFNKCRPINWLSI